MERDSPPGPGCLREPAGGRTWGRDPTVVPLPADTYAMRGRAQREDLARQLAEAQARTAQLEAELRAGADRDGLTGLASLARLRTALEIECDRGRRHGRPLALAVC